MFLLGPRVAKSTECHWMVFQWQQLHVRTVWHCWHHNATHYTKRTQSTWHLHDVHVESMAVSFISVDCLRQTWSTNNTKL